MYRITITKTADIRDTEVDNPHPMPLDRPMEGLVDALPITGERWIISLVSDGLVVCRVHTSVVQAVWHDSDAREVVCETEHSRYFVRYTLDNAGVNTLE